MSSFVCFLQRLFLRLIFSVHILCADQIIGKNILSKKVIRLNSSLVAKKYLLSLAYFTYWVLQTFGLQEEARVTFQEAAPCQEDQGKSSFCRCRPHLAAEVPVLDEARLSQL